jgi:uncharacterized protein YprB with RNaseH-like and TPR domain
MTQIFQGHKGMIHVAQYVLRTMEQESVLAEAFESYPEYKLVVTGNFILFVCNFIQF